MLASAVAAVDALPDVRLRSQSEWISSRPVGGPRGQGDYLNGAVLVDTTVAPAILLKELQQIEERLGRKPAERWAARAIDIDMLLYDREVLGQATITLPHPRLSFRRFVLAPAAEVAPKMIHPIIGWSVERLLLHLDLAADLAAIVSPADERRGRLVRELVGQAGAKVAEAPALGGAGEHWPAAWTTWLVLPAAVDGGSTSATSRRPPYAAAMFPKLTILLDPAPSATRPVLSKWASFVRQPGRGPTLRIGPGEEATMLAESAAAIECVWSDLGRM